MATDLTPQPTAAAGGSWPPRDRFAAAFIALAVILVAAAVGSWLLTRVDRPQPFSTYEPTGTDPVDRAQQIADHVSARYVAPDGTPIASVTAGEDVIPDLPGRDQIVAITDPNQTNYAFEQYIAGESGLLFYKLCGSGPGCTLPPGANPQLLLPMYARESLELALYGLKYVKPAKGVVVELPTGFDPATSAGSAPRRTVFYFPEKRVRDLLDRPLDETYPTAPPPLGTFTGADLGTTTELVQTSLYAMDANPSPDSTTVNYRLTAIPPA